MKKPHEIVWDSCLTMIREYISPTSFKTWFEPIESLELNRNVLTIQVPSPFFYEYLEEKFIDILRKSLNMQLGSGAKLKYHVKKSTNTFTNTKSVNRLQSRNSPQAKVPAVGRQEIRNPFVIPGIRKTHIDPQLNPAYSFDNFVEGECNRLARSAAGAVAQNPGKTAFNPLLFYGDCGLGKTHLAQAIGNEVKKRMTGDNEKVVLYVTANKFQTQYVDAIKNNNTNDFLNFYQMIDVLIIDDVHEFAGKEKTQNTFFHIFNHLHQLKKQLILTSDRPPSELKGLEQRLLSRFKWGLSADLKIPDYETRLAILRHKMLKERMSVPYEILNYLADNIQASVRELEGALISLLAHSTLTKKEISIELTSDVISNLVKTNRKELTVSNIQKVVAEYFNLGIDDLQSKTRKRDIVQARQIAMYFAKDLTKASLSTIGSQIGRKDHATVLHAYKAIRNLVDTDNKFKAHINEINKRLKVL